MSDIIGFSTLKEAVEDHYSKNTNDTFSNVIDVARELVDIGYFTHIDVREVMTECYGDEMSEKAYRRLIKALDIFKAGMKDREDMYSRDMREILEELEDSND